MDVFLMRHGKAEPPSLRVPSDYRRPLTGIGRDEMALVGRAMRRMKVRPDILATSPLVRAAQTAKIISKHVKVAATEWEELRPESPPEKTVRAIHSSGADRVMVVGHEPHLSAVISHMICGSDTASISLRKGGMACVRIPVLGPGTLRYLLTPRHMVMMA